MLEVTPGLGVRLLRVAQGLSQTQLAAASSLSVGSVSEIETGKRRPKPEVLARLAAALRVEEPTEPVLVEIPAMLASPTETRT